MSTFSLADVVLDVAFQPLVALESATIFGYEALGRPRSRDGRPIAIADLLAEATTRGETLALDRALRRRAIERIAERPRDPRLRWFLNVDSRCVDTPGFAPGFTRRRGVEREAAPFCDLKAPACAEGTVCTPWYGPMDFMLPFYKDLGVCQIPG